MTSLTTEQLREMDLRREQITSPPWTVIGNTVFIDPPGREDARWWALPGDTPTADFIAHAPHDFDLLRAEVARLTRELEEAKAEAAVLREALTDMLDEVRTMNMNLDFKAQFRVDRAYFVLKERSPATTAHLERDRKMEESLRPFPMQGGPPITWSIARRIYAVYSSLYGTGQSLERIAERHGFGWEEVALMWADPRARTALSALGPRDGDQE